MTTLADIEWLDPLVEGQRNRELERYVKGEMGHVPPHTRFFGACPWIMRADIDLDVGCAHVNDLAQLIYLTVITALSESIEPDVLVRILNGYFERMSRAITDHRGHVSTFIGDGILALFGALQPNPWQGNDAVYAALAMREELAAYNRELEAEGLPTLSIGIGLHRGGGVAALVGSRDLMQFTFVGRIVNLAARVQDLTRKFQVDILVTRAVKDTLDRRFALRELPATPVRGIAGEVEIFAVEKLEGER